MSDIYTATYGAAFARMVLDQVEGGRKMGAVDYDHCAEDARTIALEAEKRGCPTPLPTHLLKWLKESSKYLSEDTARPRIGRLVVDPEVPTLMTRLMALEKERAAHIRFRCYECKHTSLCIVDTCPKCGSTAAGNQHFTPDGDRDWSTGVDR